VPASGPETPLSCAKPQPLPAAASTAPQPALAGPVVKQPQRSTRQPLDPAMPRTPLLQELGLSAASVEFLEDAIDPDLVAGGTAIGGGCAPDRDDSAAHDADGAGGLAAAPGGRDAAGQRPHGTSAADDAAAGEEPPARPAGWRGAGGAAPALAWVLTALALAMLLLVAFAPRLVQSALEVRVPSAS